ncbi:MAG: sugar phosphate nucleotidyltransferase [Alphaproteobacteria bacterium]|jgi:dTDP-glucose pyrophosphorylase|uniref:sugar phosphate nucleotidyltransferase n=1 Tax=Pacificispira sp. TaxID=2888761 RepID=UPI001B04EF09|nr:NTP transferase domain-containing protein [Alphaproteobacteria bacterium]MBO6861269.1 NTP transferase domain-containing protein [Alphaproteobacteria bacterium]
MSPSNEPYPDADPYLCPGDISARAALAKINELTHQFLIIVDTEKRPIGTLTDGDIRRGLLSGHALDEPVDQFMFRNFKLGRLETAREDARLLRDRERPVPFLPLVDKAGVVQSVLVRDILNSPIDMAVVMAGGFGKRLGDLTKDIPKPLVEVNGRPILDHVLQALEDAGVAEIYLTLHYRADQIREFIAQRRNRAEILFIYEETPLGTAGSLSLLPKRPQGPFLVVNGDIITDVDYSALSGFQSDTKLDGVLCVSQYRQQIPYGVVEVENGSLLGAIREKPTVVHNVASGIYLLSPSFLNLIEHDEVVDMPTVLERAKSLRYRIGVFPIHEYWIDLGRPTDLDAARKDRSR